MNAELETQNPEPGTQQLLRRELHPKTTVPSAADNAPANTLDFRSSDQTLDRYQEVITVAGWKLDNYRKNPVVQNAHSYWSLADTIGKALITEVRLGTQNSEPETYLFQRIQFAVEENPMAKLAYGLYKGGFLNAVSVGFIPIRWEDSPSSSSSSSSLIRRKYLEQELLEVSAVSIPANPNALALGLKEGAIEKGDLRELAALLREICQRHGATRMPPLSTNPDYEIREYASNSCQGLAQLRQQLHEIRSILKHS
jgi:HK97 family phage prohead protease